MRIPPKYLKITGIVLFALILIVIIGGAIAYTKREALLKSAITKAISKAKREYDLNVAIGNASFAGLKTVQLSDISVVPQNRDSLAHINKLRVGIRLMPLLFGDIKIAELKIDRGMISLVKKDTVRNYDFLFRKKDTGSSEVKSNIDLADVAGNLLNQVLYKIPQDMDLRDFELKWADDTSKLNFYTTSATIVNGQVKSTIRVNGKQSVWHVDGSVEPDDKQLDLKLYADGKKVELPYIKQKFDLKLSFDTIHTQMKNVKRDGDELSISGTWAIKNLLINHWRLADNDIVVPSGSIDANMLVGENYISIDSSSVIHLKNIKANPFIKYTLYPQKVYELKLHTGEMNAQDLFNSFPQGLFESLEDMQVAGKLQYDLSFYLNEMQPDRLRFDSQLKNKDFRVIKWGKSNLSKITQPFVYTPYEFGKPMRNIRIGPGNYDYTPINQISPNLRNAVLTAEDPSFYRHNGFVEESFRKSIATNFKEKAFKRGGSTISMQLVKNVYLNRTKNVARKIEEMLIVWVIENTNMVSKNRMFEVYLNLIEWGRNVYGIGEASRFYFDTTPENLTLGQSIFLASIVPRPKSGLYFFEGDGTLRSSLRGYFKLIGNIMARRGLTQPDSNAYGFYSVLLKESLRRGVDTVDSSAIDTLLREYQESDEGGILQQLFGQPPADSARAKGAARQDTLKKDTAKTPEDRRRERREQRRREREERRKNGSGGLLF